MAPAFPEPSPVFVYVYFDGFLYASMAISFSFILTPTAANVGGIVGGTIAAFAVLFVVFGLYLRRRYKLKGYVELSLGDFLPLIFGNFSTTNIYKITADKTQLDELESMILELPKENGVSLVSTLGGVTAVTEQDPLSKSIVYMYESQLRGLDLLDVFIQIEVARCAEFETLFRGNSFTTKLFKFYSKIVGLPYLFHTLAGIVYEVSTTADPDIEEKKKDGSSIELTSESSTTSQPPNLRLDATVKHYFHIDTELDPNKLADVDSEDVNTYTLLLYSQKILTAIFKSSAYCPIELRRFFKIVQKHVAEYFPGRENKAIGAFYFLRFTCSAVSVPESYGLIKKVPSKNARRNLVLITKVLQNLANEIVFGKKESYMLKMNDFITTNIPKLTQFYQKLLAVREDQPNTQPVGVTEQVKTNSIAFIYNHMIQNKTKIENYLKDGDNEEKKKLLGRIEKIISEIGEPFEKSKPKPIATVPTTTTTTNTTTE